MQFKIDGLETMPGTDARVTVHKLSDGSQLPMSLPPLRNGEIPEESQAAAQPVRDAANALAAYDIARGKAAADVTLSDVGREQKLKPLREAAQAAVDIASAQINGLEASTASLHAQAFAPPKMEATDIEGALIDQEIRAHVRSLGAAERTEYLKGIAGAPRHLEALMRSPVPIPVVSEHARRLWTEKLEGSPAAVKAKGYSDAIEWGRTLLDTIKRKI